MIGALMLYSVLVGVLLAAGGALAERTLRLARWPARAVWVLALAGTLGMPLLTLRRTEAPAGVMDDVSSPATVATAVAPRGRLLSLRWPAISRRVDRPLEAVWLALSLGLVTAGAVGLVRLVGARRRWVGFVVDGHDVLVSDGFGPLVIGLFRPRVVLPRWALELGGAERELILAHEEEHRAARDPLLLACGALAVAAAPWNPAVWWQARRLRAALELDCDRRVLRRGTEPIAYGQLLLRIGSRSGERLGLPVAALKETNVSILERRLTMITSGVRVEWRRAMVAGAAAAAMVALACETPKPSPTEPVTAAKALAATGGQLVARSPGLLFIDGVEAEVRWEWGASNQAAIGRLAGLGLTPNDIARIEVIKPEASIALFGEKGRNGVIQIYTKKAAGREKAEVGTVVPPDRAELYKTVDLVVDGQRIGGIEAKLEMGAHPGEAYVVTHGERIPVKHIEVLTGPAATTKYGPGAGKIVEISTK